jgi:SAM-dependent methyltransferase
MTIPAMFQTRERCISCVSTQSIELSSGLFGEQPARGYIESDPWGEDPMPHLKNAKWALQQCAECGQKQHRYILSPEWNEIRFTQWMSEDAIRQFEAQHGTGESSATDHVQHVLRLKKLGVHRILDFGCGFGQFLEMCRLFGMEAIGVDRSQARRSGANASIVADLDETEGSFDAITMFEVLEHLDDPLATLKMLVGRLKPGGIMIVEVPDTSGVTDIATRDHYYKVHPLDHINAFTPKTLVALMGRVGLAPMRKRPAFVTTSLERVAKDIGKAIFKQETTQRYFRLR